MDEVCFKKTPVTDVLRLGIPHQVREPARSRGVTDRRVRQQFGKGTLM